MARYFISGSGGSWGRELIKLLLTKSDTEHIVGLCRAEARADHLLAINNRDPRLSIYLADIRDSQRIEQAMRDCTRCIHLAALKRIDTALYSPSEMSSVNIEGTKVMIHAMIENEVSKGFYVSTDKAAFPTTFYGLTKGVAEQLWLSADDIQGITTSAARFGNALGSTGSVLEIWAQCVREGKPLPVRFKGHATRYLITLPWAVSMIHGYLQQMQGGELYLPTMPAATLYDLAVAFAGYQYPLEFVEGTVMGEKEHETLDGIGSSGSARRLTVGEIRDTLRSAGIPFPAEEK